MCVERAPVALETAETVAHRVGVFAQDQRPLLSGRPIHLPSAHLGTAGNG